MLAMAESPYQKALSSRLTFQEQSNLVKNMAHKYCKAYNLLSGGGKKREVLAMKAKLAG